MTLTISGLSKRFSTRQGKITALQDINIHVKRGELICMVGASGCGKSTLLRLIAGLDTPSDGEIQVDGYPVSAPGADRGMVFQQYTLYPWMTVAQNVGFGLDLQGTPRQQLRQKVGYYLSVVELSGFSQSYPKELSGGMKQRVAIARALACEPKILLLDEPFGALDVQTKEAMQKFLMRVWLQTGITILMITHDVEEAIFLSQRIYVMRSRPGSIREELSINLPVDKSIQDSFEMRQLNEFQFYRSYITRLLHQSE
ncbi:ABC transporter ATP-binding protein [Synechococcus sp. PCC 7336]|uniref:ABC transporter ATP-binding protein n=1 Tax=Synechococcus sp. PCC 7336 TaxID=195250 RepID=UPI0003467706|nr:ABC transporter ATP-binding protein [Synechococcus sp. PCC 7336]